MKMMHPQIEVELIDCQMPKFPLAQIPAPKRLGAQTLTVII